VAGTLLSLYAPWIMLAIVLLFVAAFVLYGPRLARMVIFDLRIVMAWFAWLAKRLFRSAQPQNLGESLAHLTLHRRKEFGANLEAGEEMLGAVEGWKRSRRGPRRGWMVVTGSRLLLVERRLLRKHKLQSFAWGELVLVRHRNLGLFERIELVTRENQSITFNLCKTHGRFGALATETICRLGGITPARARIPSSTEPKLAPAVR
jgi:Bacterial PH domain